MVKVTSNPLSRDNIDLVVEHYFVIACSCFISYTAVETTKQRETQIQYSFLQSLTVLIKDFKSYSSAKLMPSIRLSKFGRVGSEVSVT
jgi:hypothetical protein